MACNYCFGDWRSLRLDEILAVASKFNVCPKCNSREGFWLGIRRNHAYVQCKGCGASFELFEVFSFGEKGEAPKHLKFFRK
jgi:transposase-like protein